MNQPKKNSNNVEMSSALNTEAAIKFLPLNSKDFKTSDGGPTDKDGFEPGGTDLLSVNIEVALNGFYVIFSIATPEGIAQDNYVAATIDEVFELIRGNF